MVTPCRPGVGTVLGAALCHELWCLEHDTLQRMGSAVVDTAGRPTSHDQTGSAGTGHGKADQGLAQTSSLLGHSRDAFMLLERGRPAHQGHGVDRGCPLNTARVRLMWHVGGTSGRHARQDQRRRRLLHVLDQGPDRLSYGRMR